MYIILFEVIEHTQSANVILKKNPREKKWYLMSKLMLNSTTHYVRKDKNQTISRFPKWLTTCTCNSLMDKSSYFLSRQMFWKSCGRHCIWRVNDLGQTETALWGLLRRGIGEALTLAWLVTVSEFAGVPPGMHYAQLDVVTNNISACQNADDFLCYPK